MENFKELQPPEDFIPLNISTYNKVIALLYKKVMFRPKYFLLFMVMISPIYFITSFHGPNDLALLVTLGIFFSVLIVFPPLFVYLIFVLAKLKLGKGLRKAGHLKDV